MIVAEALDRRIVNRLDRWSRSSATNTDHQHRPRSRVDRRRARPDRVVFTGAGRALSWQPHHSWTARNPGGLPWERTSGSRAIVAFAGLALIAIVYQFIDGRNRNAEVHATNELSFFSIQTSIFAAIVLLLAARSTIGSSSANSIWRAATVLWLATTKVVYRMLLSGYQEELPTTIPWVIPCCTG